MKLLAPWALITSLVCPQETPNAELDRLLEQAFATGSYPSVAVGVVRGKDVIFERALGIADKQTGRKATVDTIYEAGSVGKVLTTTLFAILADEGTVQIHAPVASYVPNRTSLATKLEHVTLWHLATHTSGLPANPLNVGGFDRYRWVQYSEDQLFDGLEATTLDAEPGIDLKYSNLGMGLLGHLLSKSSGSSYETLLTEKLLRPIGMVDTGSASEIPDEKKARCAIGYETAETKTPAPIWEYGVLAGCGSQVSTVRDLARFVSVQFDGRTAAGALVSPRMLKESQRPQWVAEDWSYGIGLGWFVERTPEGQTLLEHRGRTAGQCAYVILSPADEVGVVVFANRGGREASVAMAELGGELLRAVTR